MTENAGLAPSASVATAPSSPRTYEEWATRLGEHFFHCENRDVPIVLYLDDDIVAEIAGIPDAGRAVRALTNAVRPRLTRSSSSLFRRIYEEALTWKANGGGELPPFLPALAVATVAASRMASDGTMRSTNYYRRLRELLDLDGHGAPDGYDDTFPYLWRCLSWWLDDRHGGRLGLSTITRSETWPNIGYALSQTVMKRSDRMHLSELFDAMGLAGGDDDVDGPELRTAYQAWAPHSRLSIAARQAAIRSECEPQLEAILVAELAAWDGGVRDEAGNRVAQIVLELELSPIELRLSAHRPLGFPASVIAKTPAGQEIVLRSDVDGWYDAMALSVTDALESGLRLTCDGYSFRLSVRDVIPFRQDTTAGAWVSVSEVQPFTTHCVLVRERVRDKVRAYLGEHAEEGWASMAPSRRLPPGWCLFRSVAISEPSDVRVEEALEPLVPSVKGRVSLEGGLPLPSALADRQAWYLAGGEPDVWVPRWTAAGADVQVAVDATPIGTLMAGGRIPLSGRDLPPGPHEVVVGTSRRRFFTVATRTDVHPDGEGTIAHRVYRGPEGYALTRASASEGPDDALRGQVWIAGAFVVARDEDLPPPPPHLVRLRRGAVEYRLLGAQPGEIKRPICGTAPAWLRSEKLEAMFFDVTAPFRVAWALTRWGRSGWSARLVERADSVLTPVQKATPEEVAAWAATFRMEVGLTGPARDLWEEYAACAASLP